MSTLKNRLHPFDIALTHKYIHYLYLYSLQSRFQFHEERLIDFPLFDSFNLLPWHYLSFQDSVPLDEIKTEISTDRC